MSIYTAHRRKKPLMRLGYSKTQKN